MTSYRSVHEKVAFQRGKASDQDCWVCGEPAQHWAFRYDSKSDLKDPEGRPYSSDVWDYDPLCIGCHRRRDLAEDNRVAEVARKEGKRMASAHVQRLHSDPEFAARRGSENSSVMHRINTDPQYAEIMGKAREKARASSAVAARRTAKKRRRCLMCGIDAPPGPMGTHFRYSGHSGYEDLS